MSSFMTDGTSVAGTKSYWAPEIWELERLGHTHAGDVFSLGQIALKMVTGVLLAMCKKVGVKEKITTGR